MGNTLWVDVRGRLKADTPEDNSMILQLQSQIDRLSTKLNVPKLSEFYDYSELDAAYGAQDDDGDELENTDPAVEADEVPGTWFHPALALDAVRKIHDLLTQHPEDLGFKAEPSQMHWSGTLMGELKHCRSVLEGAVSRKKQFRFLIVP